MRFSRGEWKGHEGGNIQALMMTDASLTLGNPNYDTRHEICIAGCYPVANFIKFLQLINQSGRGFAQTLSANTSVYRFPNTDQDQLLSSWYIVKIRETSLVNTA